MGDLVERQFPARALLTGLRSIGYSFSSAVADIIDNSISAGASRIDVYSDPLVNIPYFCFLDNGRGMNQEELDNAMLPGSDREGVEDSELTGGICTLSVCDCIELHRNGIIAVLQIVRNIKITGKEFSVLCARCTACVGNSD